MGVGTRGRTGHDLQSEACRDYMRNHTIASRWLTFRVYNRRLPTARRRRKLVFSSLCLPNSARHNTDREAKNGRKGKRISIHPGMWTILLSSSIGVDVET